MDWISTFLTYTGKIPSPEIFRLWAGIACIAGACERRIWTRTAGGRVYPNLYTLLVAPPAVGKSKAIEQTRDLWRATKKIYCAPNSVTKAALLDNLAAASRRLVINNGKDLLEYNSLAVGSSEFGVLVPAHDTEFLSVLIDIYDNPSEFKEDRRDRTRSVCIVNPQINLIAGTQPSFLAGLLPEGAWGMGFMSRMIMVYAGMGPQIELFDFDDQEHPLKAGLVKMLSDITSLIGGANWTAEAQALLVGWYKGGMEPVPSHSKLQHYLGRRLSHTIKLAMISAVSRDQSKIQVTGEDIQRSMDWLLFAEHLMPDIFREMIGRSDKDVLYELHLYCWNSYMKTKRPMHQSAIFNFMSDKVPSEKIPRILDLAEKSNILVRIGGTQQYTPRARHEWGVE